MSPATEGEVVLATVTRTSMVPAFSAGEVAEHDVVDAQVTAVAATAPKETVVAAAVTENPVPVMVTGVPPKVEPLVGEIDDTTGPPVLVYVNCWAPAVGELWPSTLTITLTGPGACGGDTATQLLALEQVTAVAASAPKATVVTPGVVANPVPVMVTAVPPVIGPVFGARPDTVGAATVV